MSPSNRALAAAFAGLSLLACTPRDSGKTQSVAFETHPVVAPRIAALEREVASDPLIAAPDPDLVERVRGLVLDFPMAQSKMRALQLEEIASIGDPALPVLAQCIADETVAEDRRIVAVEFAAAIDTARSVDLVVTQVEKSRSPRIRASAARALVDAAQDEVVPRLLLRLKYEIDGETVVWIAVVLARFGNYAGLDGLRTLAGDDRNPEVRAFANDKWVELASAAGIENGDGLWKAWNGDESAGHVPPSQPSTRRLLALWRWIAKLAEHDLRVVDDARFVLSRSDASIVGPLCDSLHDEVAYIRVHAAQCLERMGPRARAAGPALVEALSDVRLAPTAAAALGAVDHPESGPALIRSLDARADAELRVSAARALARVNQPDATKALSELLRSNDRRDLRQAAAQSLVAHGRGDEAATFLTECLTAPGADASGAEAALEQWLVDRAQRSDRDAESLLERWRSFADPQGKTPDPRALLERQKARAALLASNAADQQH